MGCRAGVLGHAIKQKPEVIVWGVESNRLLVNYAKTKLDKVICCSYEDAAPSLPDNFFDTIIFENFECMSHPYSLLTSMKHKLTSGGEIIVSITNIRQWSIIRNLIQGDWNYDYYGAMDRRNLRFYTRNSIVSLFQNSGYYVVSINAEDIVENQIPEEVLTALTKTGIDTSTLKKESGLFQFFVKGVKPSKEKEPLHKKAELLLENGQYMIARDIYASLNSEVPYSTQTLYGLALCSIKSNDTHSALQHLKKVLEIEPGHPGAYHQIGTICLDQGDLETARSMFFEAIMRSPDFVKAKCNYAETLVKLGNIKGGILVFENILNTVPGNVEALLCAAHVYDQLGDSQIASSLAERALTSDASSMEAADLLQTLKKKETVESIFSESKLSQAHPNPADTEGTDISPGIGRFLLNSIPKGGSNLLSKIVDMFPRIDFSEIVISKPDHLDELPMGDLGVMGVGRDGYLGNPPEWNTGTKVPVGVDWPIMEDLDKIFFILSELKEGTFATGHVPYSRELSRLISEMGIKTFLILRDPRDVVVSHAFFVSENPYNTCYELYRHLSTGERIMTSIAGIQKSEEFGIKLLNIRERIECLLPWTSSNGNCTILFERLVGPEGRGTLSVQMQELNKIATHLGFNCSHQELEDLRGNVFGGTETFRSGTSGGWKAHMGEEHKDACKSLIGQVLIDLGYEKNFDW